ncbi:MAG: phage terminase large subunit family protein [Rhizobium sp.]|nr:phage terminase large subunit family protein [Rhizobium sp.]
MLDVEHYLGPLVVPSYPDPGKLLVAALPAVRPPRRISVPEWAGSADGRRIRSATYNGPWRNEFAPYMVEPARMTTSRKYRAVCFVGPARSVKSDALVLNLLGHRVVCMPRDMKIICPTKEAARLFSLQKIKPMMNATPAVTSRLAKVRNADSINDKLFEGGMSVRIGWPVSGEFSMLDIPDMVVTDFDRIDNPDDIDGEGALFDLALKRTETFGSLGMSVFESSPGKPITDADWEASTPHEAPPCTGILSIYNRGTRGNFYWECPHCHERFRPLMSTLHFERKATPGETAKTVFMVCPAGCVIGPDRKITLNAAGVWLHEANDGELVEIDDPDIRDTDVVSYWAEGPIAAVQSWKALIQREQEALEVLERTGDEGSLKATVTLDQGRPYLPKANDVEDDGLDTKTLKSLAKPYPLGIVPAGARFLTVAVDVQSHRFVVHVHAWGVGLETWLIDRLEIVTPPAGAPGADRQRAIDPPRYLEDWAVLPPLREKIYPVADSDYGLRPVALVSDSAGEAGVTEKAYAFYRQQKKLGHGKRTYLAKGQGGFDRDRVRHGKPDKILQKKAGNTSDIRLVYSGIDKLKDEVTLSLTRSEAGPGAYHLSSELDDRVFAEYCAETRGDKGWTKRKKSLPNEALDLAVMSKALVIVLKGEKIDWDRPPEWALPVANNSFAVRLAAPSQPDAVPARQVAPSPHRGRRVRSSAL